MCNILQNARQRSGAPKLPILLRGVACGCAKLQPLADYLGTDSLPVRAWLVKPLRIAGLNNLAMFLQNSPAMNRRLDIVQCDPEVPAGAFADLLAEWQIPFCLHRPDLGEPLPDTADAVIVLGGRMGVHDEALHPFLGSLKAQLKRLLCAETPSLGLCLGGQLLADVLGGVVSSNRCSEKGLVEISLNASGTADPLFAGAGRSFQAFQWHNARTARSVKNWSANSLVEGRLIISCQRGCWGISSPSPAGPSVDTLTFENHFRQRRRTDQAKRPRSRS